MILYLKFIEFYCSEMINTISIHLLPKCMKKIRIKCLNPSQKKGHRASKLVKELFKQLRKKVSLNSKNST